MEIRTLTVSEVTNYLKRIFINDPILNNLSVKGEISNFKFHSSGHAYFSIKDELSKLKCIMFSSEAKNLGFMPRDGMKVVVKGYVSIYERNSEYQLYVYEMEEEGFGDLYIKFEKLKKKLESKGYFDIEKKKKLPFLPKKIGVVTSPTGAAVRDIISIITRRNRLVDILIYPVLVQGEDAPYQISRAIDDLNERKDIDLIIIARGGGSIEELWAFNEEIVAESIYKSKIPIISAVGHETDFTIADFVADLRAPTPSAAGEISTPDLRDIIREIDRLYSLLINKISDSIDKYREIIDGYREERLKKYITYKFNEEKLSLDYLYNNLCSIINNDIKIKKKEMLSLANELNNLSPLATIGRGYSITQDDKNNIITGVNEVKQGDRIRVLLKDGILGCKVEDIMKGEIIIEEGSSREGKS